jgi:hypothetical protein
MLDEWYFYTPEALLPVKGHPYPLNMGLGELQSRYGNMENKKSFDPQNAVVQATACRYSNWAALSFRRATIDKKQAIV